MAAAAAALNQVALNETIAVNFSQPVDLANGTSPAGVFSLDPGNHKRLLFRPQLVFDAAGNPVSASRSCTPTNCSCAV